LQEDDVTLIRFMRAREYDLQKAEDMLRKSLKWRKENLDKILEWKCPQIYLDALPFRICGVDNIGATVIWLRLGHWHGRQLIEQGLKQECLKYGNWIIEKSFATLKNGGNKPCHVIVGIEDLSLYQITHIETMQTLFAGFQNLEQNYPEVLKRVHIVNAPWMFTMAFNFIKPILSAHTLAKIQVFGSNKKQWLPVLQEFMPRKTIPKEYLDSENNNDE